MYGVVPYIKIPMADASDSDWNFFGKLDGAEHELTQMCVWEYARECQALIDKVSKLRDDIGNLSSRVDPEKDAWEAYIRVCGKGCLSEAEIVAVRLDPKSRAFRQLSENERKRRLGVRNFLDNWEKRTTEIAAIVRRFDWRFLLSASFPREPWTIARKSCRIIAEAPLYKSSAMPSGETRTVRVRHGRHLRNRKITTSPKIFPFQVNLQSYDERGDMTEINELTSDILEIAGRDVSGRVKLVHCFVVPDDYFERHDAEMIGKSFRRICGVLDRRRLIENEANSGAFRRVHLQRSLEWLGIIRFFNKYSSAERVQIIERLGRSSRAEDRGAQKVLAPLVDAKGSRDGEARKKATELYCEIFHLPADARPNSYRRRA